MNEEVYPTCTVPIVRGVIHLSNDEIFNYEPHDPEGVHEEGHENGGGNAEDINVQGVNDGQDGRFHYRGHIGASIPTGPYWKDALGSREQFEEMNHATLNVGGLNHRCPFCHAYYYYGESLVRSRTNNGATLRYSNCCKFGKVSLPIIMNPPVNSIMERYLKNTDRGVQKWVMPHIRNYNQALCFGSHQVKLDDRLDGQARNGIYSYRIQGGYYHRIGSALPGNGQDASFAQIYFYDANFNKELERRMAAGPNGSPWEGLREDIMGELQRIMHDYNPLVRELKHTMETVQRNDNFRDYTIHIRADVTHERPVDAHAGRYNEPTVPEIAALCPTMNAPAAFSNEKEVRRNIKMNLRGGAIACIHETHAWMDPMMYPLLFPHGDYGWHLNIPYNNPVQDLGGERRK